MSTGVVKQPSSHFCDIPRDECQALLAAQSTGRVAWNAPDGPQVLPVTYGVYAGDIVFRTSRHGVLAQLDNPTIVAFGIDDLDQAHRAGWSVVARGRARGIVAPHELVKLWTQPGIVPWAAGIRNLWIGISIRMISGRQVNAPFVD
jgi:nitroimidazol reductase NimA-like FMN-containing flavoprotein (pyridoxamine 5'-phosphate oxidase superfamily)